MGSKVTKRVLELIEAFPAITRDDLCQLTGTDQTYLQQILKKAGKLPPKDQFGFRVGTINSKVAARFVEGCTMLDLKAEFHGRSFHWLLRKLRERGHQVNVRDEAGEKSYTVVPKGLEKVEVNN